MSVVFVCYVYVMRTDQTYRDECSTHGVALTRTLCTHQLIMFTARLSHLADCFRLAAFRHGRSTRLTPCIRPRRDP
jgi:hypothetical protein